ncbi:ARM repeat-containing protein [Ceraceosorus guamensis]|uniref:Deoxyhypusine hydroxylase n=1 Tax=Ceraceosorus guamensis TaxID=1522189 RepID=A0A316VR52_9BASI|nr:ARM repeat-containing protein [Ceraceosorus guamensis]PWN40139.1 ARM repeat-containing protein [Ceraceosorus guamensis]
MKGAPSISSLRSTLLNSSSTNPLDARFRALFTLKGLACSSSISTSDKSSILEAIGAAFSDDSALLKHEVAYVLGQIQDEQAIAVLISVLQQQEEHAMVRHEAAEALGAIGHPKALPVLRTYLQDGDVSVRETCDLAIRKIEWDQSVEGREDAKKRAKEGKTASFAPIDPAPALSSSQSLSATISASRAVLTDSQAQLFQRYRAMFALRDAVHASRKEADEKGLSREERATHEELAKKAILALADGLEDQSALFRHEICFVFGELAHPASVPSMLRVLSDTSEHEMVRHEAAEALGAVAEDASEEGEGGDDEEEGEAAAAAGKCLKSVLGELRRWAEDEEAPRVVRESCVVALDELKYNNDPTQFQRVEA